MRRTDRGSAAVEFVLVAIVVVPLFVAVLNLALVLFVRNSLSAAASEGARHGARPDHGLAAGIRVTRDQIADVLAGRYARDITARHAAVHDQPGVEVTVRASVPALGLGGFSVDLEVHGRAILEPR